MENDSDTRIKFTALIFLISGSLARNVDVAVQSQPTIKENKYLTRQTRGRQVNPSE